MSLFSGINLIYFNFKRETLWKKQNLLLSPVLRAITSIKRQMARAVAAVRSLKNNMNVTIPATPTGDIAP